MFRIQDFYFVSCGFPTIFYYITLFHFSAGPNPYHIAMVGLGSYPFAHHYLGNRSFTFFSSWYLDVSVPKVPFNTLCIYVLIPKHYLWCVPTFGYPRIIAYLRLPVAFRSLSRPSSASSAKASTIRSFSLDRIFVDFLGLFERTFSSKLNYSSYYSFNFIKLFYSIFFSTLYIYIMQLSMCFCVLPFRDYAMLFYHPHILTVNTFF